MFNNSGINYHSTLNYIIKKSECFCCTLWKFLSLFWLRSSLIFKKGNQHKKKKYSASSQNIINQYQERSIPRIDEAENSEIERSRNPENFYEKSRMKFEPVNEPPYMVNSQMVKNWKEKHFFEKIKNLVGFSLAYWRTFNSQIWIKQLLNLLVFEEEEREE